MEETNTITLKMATHVNWSNVLEISDDLKQYGSSYLVFKCGKCGLELGKIYKSTPAGLDHLRNAFTFDMSALLSYTLGSADLSQNLESIPTEKLGKMNTGIDMLNTKITNCIQRQHLVEERLSKLEKWKEDSKGQIVSNSSSPLKSGKRVRDSGS